MRAERTDRGGGRADCGGRLGDRGPRPSRARQTSSSGANRTHPGAVLARVAERVAELAEDLQDLAEALANQLDGSAAASPVGGVNSNPTTDARRASFLTVRDVAERLQVDPKTVRRWRQEERLPTPVTFGGVIRWRPEAIDAWLEEQERSA